MWALAVAFGATVVAARAGSLEEIDEGPGFAVVELFTSQGCSSCPPADRLLARLAAIAEQKGLEIYPLSMHVDYWNRLGWRDPFSDVQFSARQQRYAGVLGNGAYTPQVVVNGTDETVGSRESDLRRLIEKNLAQAPETEVRLDVRRDGRKLRLKPTVKDGPTTATHWIALTRRTAANRVPSGENAGRTLAHAHVVFALEKVPAGVEATFELPAELAGETVTVTVAVQDPGSMRIVGAARAQVAPDASAS